MEQIGSERTLAAQLQFLDQKQECWIAREINATNKIKATKRPLRNNRKKIARPQLADSNQVQPYLLLQILDVPNST